METKETKGEIVLRKFLKDKLEEIKPLGQNVVSVAAQNLQKKLLDQMCRLDALFRVMYKDNKIQGSVKKSLKVGNPDEFDLDLCLKLPIADPRVIQIQEHKEFPSWFHCTFPKVAWIWPVPRSRQRRAWRKLFTEYAEDSKVVHLRADSVRSWLQGLVHRAIKSHEELRQINIKETRSGPAITLVFAIEATEVSMDLVAALEIPEESWSPDFSGKYEGVKTSSFLIPVAPRVPLHSPPPPSNLLRGSFPELEEHLLKGQDSLKDNIRLLKVKYARVFGMCISNMNCNSRLFEVIINGIRSQAFSSPTYALTGVRKKETGLRA